MREIELLVALLVVITALAEVANRVSLPYPVLLVLTGIGLGLVPGLPRVVLAPDLVFFVILPPLLYSAAWQASWPDFKAARRPIVGLGLGLMVFSTGLVAAVAHYCLPGFGWATAFVLGAVVSPTDTVAAVAATKNLPVPKRVATVLEGESMVNDAAGLIAYRYAVAAVATGQFAAWQAGGQLLWVAGAGVGIGLALGVLFYGLHRLSNSNAVVDISLTFLTPYAAYLLAEEAHASGVLAVVTTGLFLSRRSARIFTHDSRLQTTVVWNTVVFLLNGAVFVLIGLELPVLMEGIGKGSFGRLAGYGALVSLTVIGGRLLWVYAGAYLPRRLSRRVGARGPRPDAAPTAVVAWTGMRGVLSLAAALALPLALPSGAAFPQRSLILLLTFAVIFVTLVLQGLSLAPLIRWLGLRPDGKEEEEEQTLRVLLATHIAAYLDSPAAAAQAPAEVLDRMKTRYVLRLQRLRERPSGDQAGGPDEKPLTPFQQLQEVLIRFERGVIEQLRREEKISEEALRKVENELDLEESRMALDRA